jgi:thiamine biosynthesis lipoprotein
MVRHCLIAMGVLLSLTAGLASAQEPPLQKFSFTQVHMGTEFKIVLYAPKEEIAKKAADAAFLRVAELNNTMSDYKKTSELMRLCEKSGGPPVKVSRDLFDVVAKAQDLSKKSDGAFDITVGPVVKLWRKARKTGEMPDPDRLKAALAKVGYQNIRLDPAAMTIQLLIEGMLLDLGAIAKGFAAEAALAVLRRFGITRALVVAGGDIVCGEAPPGEKGWKVGIGPLKNPTAPPKQFLLLKNAAVSTAGDVEQYVVIDRKRYSHIVDPKTGLGLVGHISVTVVSPNGTTSDSLDTTVCALGLEKGLKLVEDTPGAAAYIVREVKGELVTTTSERLSQYLLAMEK